MDAIGADYWREMGLVTPTVEFVAENDGRDIKFEASVRSSSMILPEDKIFPEEAWESSELEVMLNIPLGKEVNFKARFLLSGHVDGIGNFYASKKNLDAASWLSEQINQTQSSVGIFGGRINLGQTLVNSKYVVLELGYAEFPKDSGIVYLFDRRAPFVSSQ